MAKGRKIKNPEITKEDFLKALEESNGNCYAAYTKIGLAYSRYYDWRKTDPEFDAACEKLQQSMVKFAESKMFELIGAGDRTMIKFYLNSRGSYTEKKEVKVESNNTVDVTTKIEEIKEELQ